MAFIQKRCYNNKSQLKGIIMTKICIKCDIEKPVELFSKRTMNRDGLYSYCKVCAKQERQAYARTKHGLLTDLFNRHNTSYEKRGVNSATYSKDELMIWALEQDLLHSLHSAWVDSGYKKKLTPSIDRKKDDTGYNINNIINQNKIR